MEDPSDMADLILFCVLATTKNMLVRFALAAAAAVAGLCAHAKDVIIHLSDSVPPSISSSPLTTMHAFNGQEFQCFHVATALEDANPRTVAIEMLTHHLPSTCVYSQLDQNTNYWQYKLCLNQTVHQVHIEHGKVTQEILLGRFDALASPTDNDNNSTALVQSYSQGDGTRKAKIRFVCGGSENFQISYAMETAPLEYELGVTLNKLCVMKNGQALDSVPCLQRAMELEVGVNQTSNEIIKEIVTYRVCPKNSVMRDNVVIGEFTHRNPRITTGQHGRMEEFYQSKETICSSNGELIKFETRVIFTCSKTTFLPTLVTANQYSPCQLVLHVNLNQVCDTALQDVQCKLA